MKTTMICATLEQDDRLDDLYIGGDTARICCSRQQSPDYEVTDDFETEELGFVTMPMPFEAGKADKQDMNLRKHNLEILYA